MIQNNPGVFVLVIVVILAWIAFVKRFEGPWWVLVIICTVVVVVLLFVVTHIFNKMAEEY